MKILVIRHGESEADMMDVHEGRADFELTEKGHRQSQLLGEWIAAHYTVSKIYTSPLKRALQTASYLSEFLELTLCQDENLMEFNNGLIAGLDRETAAVKYPYVSDIPMHTAVYEQESLLEFRFRADYMLSKIISENPQDSTIIVVSHGGFINQLYRSFLKLPVDSDIFMSTGDTGIHCWKLLKESRRIIYSNNFSHMLELLDPESPS